MISQITKCNLLNLFLYFIVLHLIISQRLVVYMSMGLLLAVFSVSLIVSLFFHQVPCCLDCYNFIIYLEVSGICLPTFVCCVYTMLFNIDLLSPRVNLRISLLISTIYVLGPWLWNVLKLIHPRPAKETFSTVRTKSAEGEYICQLYPRNWKGHQKPNIVLKMLLLCIYVCVMCRDLCGGWRKYLWGSILSSHLCVTPS